MPAVDYYGIEEAIKAQIVDNIGRQNVAVLVEEALTFQDGDVVVIYLERRDAPASLQTMSAGTRQRYEVTFSIWSWVFGIEVGPIMERRDDLIGEVETALMANEARNFGRDDVEHWRLEGGEFENASFEGAGFGLAAETRIVARVLATT